MAAGMNSPFGLAYARNLNGTTNSPSINKYFAKVTDNKIVSSFFAGDPVTMETADNKAGALPNGSVKPYAVLPTKVAIDLATKDSLALPVVGVVEYIEYTNPQGITTKVSGVLAATDVLANTTVTVGVIDDPNVVWTIQVSTNVNANNAAFVVVPKFPSAVVGAGIGADFTFGLAGGTNFDTVPRADSTEANPTVYANNPTTGNLQLGKSAYYLNVGIADTAATDYTHVSNILPLTAIGYSSNTGNGTEKGKTIAATNFPIVEVVINNHLYKTAHYA